MNKHEFYKHENARDVAIYPLEVRDHTRGIKVRVMWVNVHYHELGCRVPFPIPDKTRNDAPLIEELVITFRDIKKWKHYDLKENYGTLKTED